MFNVFPAVDWEKVVVIGIRLQHRTGIGGAVPPLIGATMTAAHGAISFVLFLVFLCLVSLLSALGLPETRGRDLADVLAPSR
ncbi:hypothetical protein [Streptomyces sp. NPDC055105]